MMPGIFLALPKLCLLISLTAVEGSWCQAGIGSCVGQRHMFKNPPRSQSLWAVIRAALGKGMWGLDGSSFGGTLRFADWDGDGDTDILVGDGGSIWFHERLSKDALRKHELVQLHVRDGQLQSRFEVADWDGKKVVVTTSMAHFLRKRACPKVTFAGTSVPDLEASGKSWTVKALSLYQLTLHGDESTMPLDTSTGHLHLKFPQIFLSTGMWHCPLIWWCLFFLAASAGAASKLTWPLTLLLCFLGLCAGSVAFAMRRRQSEATPLVKRRRQFLKEWPLALERCSRGPDRSITAGKLHDFLQFFETFIKERSMHYVCSNIVKPLTEPFQLSFVELVGPTSIQWFVSHYWGMPVRHFSDAIRKHAQCLDGDWEDSSYWICTFSNSQWHVKEELGLGQWQNSSFYLALRSPECKGTTMIIDESVLPLQRIWCLFEVYQTISLSRSEHFHGLLLCTSTGVLQQGKAGTDVAVAVAKTVAELDTRSAKATDEEDRVMIHSLIEKMDGGFDAMNSFVRDTICSALEASHLHYESTFKTLVQNLTSRDPSSRSTPSPRSAPLPTLLTSAAPQPETKVDTN